MQRPNPDSIYYHEYVQLQEKLCAKLIALRKDRNLVQEDMANYELSVRQYQRMEQEPSSIVSLWQLFKLAKAHNIDMSDLLDL